MLPDSIDDEERLFRRIPVSMNWYDSAAETLSPIAFQPREEDKTGLSVTRAKFASVEDAARGKSKKGYYVAVMRAGDLRKCGVEVVQRGDQDHAELANINYDCRDSNQVKEWQKQLADELILEIQGPFWAEA
jgi:hypothetical protein